MTAIVLACKYLEVFQNDAVVWEQLGQLYLQAGWLEKAQFCLEEQLLLSPGDVVITLMHTSNMLFSLHSL
jgi:hypothetical protein